MDKINARAAILTGQLSAQVERQIAQHAGLHRTAYTREAAIFQVNTRGTLSALVILQAKVIRSFAVSSHKVTRTFAHETVDKIYTCRVVLARHGQTFVHIRFASCAFEA